MTNVLLECDSRGAFERCSAEGHSSYAARGKDIVCAAESCVLRTVMDMLENTEGIVLNADTSARGRVSLEVEEKISETSEVYAKLTERLVCIADFIRTAFTNLSDDYPEYVQFKEISED